MKFETRGRVLNKIAIMLLCLVVLELVLIGDQVESVKSLKKKILLKKFKKLLPLLALIKPKKKILLLPIPFPMFNKHGGNMNPPRPMIMPSTNMPRPANQATYMVVDPIPTQQASMMMLDQVNMSGGYDMMPGSSAANGPSMTMTISSDPGAMPSIELNTNMAAPMSVINTPNPISPTQASSVPMSIQTPPASVRAPLIQLPTQAAYYTEPKSMEHIEGPMEQTSYESMESSSGGMGYESQNTGSGYPSSPEGSSQGSY